MDLDLPQKQSHEKKAGSGKPALPILKIIPCD